MKSLDSSQPIGLYCHVPFCASTCDFCAFYQEKPRRDDLDRYLSAMDLEFAQLPRNRVVDTVFWGGGTPGLLRAKDLGKLGRSLLKNLSKAPVEWTVEMAPSTVKSDKLEVLRELGVTRISMGVQSFDPNLLQSLGRLHSPRQVYTAWDRVKAAGFPQSNLDLMFALPGQSIKQWEADIREAVSLGPTHLSTYCLTFEEDTAIYVKLSEGKVSIDEEKELRFYERGWELLTELGYEQYEISNFAKPDAECRHNMNTWRMHEWIGCGPSAASQYNGERYQRPASLEEWYLGMNSARSPKTERIALNDNLLLADAVIFGLRMNRGVDLKSLNLQFAHATNCIDLKTKLKFFEKEGLLKSKKTHYKLTHKGRLLCDSLGSALLHD
ncbi:MAG: radical SAM family heme chaperone HemW [Verrucomicrobiota bacterium]|nr:radical SAM family heme chaperone HemW [Verrucomicrobiota bacterium]MEC8405178.1 radical SAM family heme chaperone HemW [Verrucomicrobiota bacterium]